MSGTSIPASQFINIIPGVLAASAPPLAMNAVFVDEDGSIPVGTVQGFPNLTAVQNWYGANSIEAQYAAIYFAGFLNCTQLPGLLYFTQYNANAVAAYLRGGSIAQMTLTQIQALSGTLTVAIDGVAVTSAAINLSSATSFSNAAQLLQTGLQTPGNVWAGTVTTTNASTTVTIDTTTSGQLHVGDNLVGTDIPIGATIASFGTYTPVAGTGTVVISAAATGAAGPEAATVTLAPTVTYDSLRAAFVVTSPVTGASSTIAFPTTDALATGLLLTAATGAVLSQGAAPATPAGVMNAVVGQTQDWALFMTTWEPNISTKLQFASWLQGQDQQYAYAAWDSDPAPTQSNSDPSCFAQQVSSDNGVIPIWDPTGNAAAFACSIAASINFNATRGRTSFAYRSQAGITPNVTDATTYQNLKANGYNCYANVATRTQQLQWFQPGKISGNWSWIDPYINQIYWNSVFQNDFAELLSNVGAVPYSQLGYEMIANSLTGDIQAMGDFGAWVSGVALSSSQINEVNAAAGVPIAPTLQTQGWYLQVKDPGATVRAARGSPSCTFWYTDGGAVQQINMASIDVE